MDTTTLRETVAGEVRARMARKRVRQVDLAEVLGMSQPSLSQRLTGRYPFTVDELDRLAQFFDVEPADLIRGTPWFPGPDETAEAAIARHPTGAASVLVEAERLISDPHPADRPTGDMSVTAA